MSRSPPVLPGITLSHRLGAGASGEVWAGTVVAGGLPVAVKLVPAPPGGDPHHMQERALQEARFCFGLDHAHVVRILGYDTAPNGAFYIVMERLDGETLAERVARIGPLTPSVTLRIARQTAQALAAIHARGALHRDIKPENLFLAVHGGRDDYVKVLDFGIVALEQGDPDRLVRTAAGLICGTPAYMAPEHIRGLPIDARADIYALGATLAFALTGHLLVEAPTLDALMRLAAAGAPPPQFPASVPVSVAQLVRQMISLDAALRPRDARILLRALDAAEAPLAGPSGETTFHWAGETLTAADMGLPALDDVSDLERFKLHLAQAVRLLFPGTLPPDIAGASEGLRVAEAEHRRVAQDAVEQREAVDIAARTLGQEAAAAANALDAARSRATVAADAEPEGLARQLAAAADLETLDAAWMEAWREAVRAQRARRAAILGPLPFAALFDEEVEALLARMGRLHDERDAIIGEIRALRTEEQARHRAVHDARREVFACEAVVRKLDAEREVALVPRERAARLAEDAAADAARTVEQAALDLAMSILQTVARWSDVGRATQPGSIP